MFVLVDGSNRSLPLMNSGLTSYTPGETRLPTLSSDTVGGFIDTGGLDGFRSVCAIAVTGKESAVATAMENSFPKLWS